MSWVFDSPQTQNNLTSTIGCADCIPETCHWNGNVGMCSVSVLIYTETSTMRRYASSKSPSIIMTRSRLWLRDLDGISGAFIRVVDASSTGNAANRLMLSGKGFSSLVRNRMGKKTRNIHFQHCTKTTQLCTGILWIDLLRRRCRT
jgi:hypothetical protein